MGFTNGLSHIVPGQHTHKGFPPNEARLRGPPRELQWDIVDVDELEACGANGSGEKARAGFWSGRLGAVGGRQDGGGQCNGAVDVEVSNVGVLDEVPRREGGLVPHHLRTPSEVSANFMYD